MNWQYILYNVDSGVAHVVLNRPEKLNALGMGPGSNRVEMAGALDGLRVIDMTSVVMGSYRHPAAR
jgi:hypothetical protein